MSIIPTAIVGNLCRLHNGFDDACTDLLPHLSAGDVTTVIGETRIFATLHEALAAVRRHTPLLSLEL
jgi:hypothetical protein